MAQNMELSLPILQDFPSISGNIDIVERTAPHYKSIGTQLLDDKDGAIVSGMEKANAFKPVPIMENIYERWMKSDKSWQKLIQCLKSRKLNVLAQEIEDTLKHKGQGADGGAVHTDGPGQPQDSTGAGVLRSEGPEEHKAAATAPAISDPEETVITNHRKRLVAVISTDLTSFSTAFIQIKYIDGDAASDITTATGQGGKAKAAALLDAVVVNLTAANPKNKQTWFEGFVAVFSGRVHKELGDSMRKEYKYMH